MCSTNFSAIIFILFMVTEVKASAKALSECLYAQDVCPNPEIKFWLYKKETAEPVLLNPLQLDANDFQPWRPLKILIHGYTGNREISPNAEVRPALLETQNVHVVSLDYGELVKTPCYYPWSVKNAPIVAKCLAQFINHLIACGIYVMADIHLIGFSLGGQIAGLTANYVEHKLNRITGLDPARPGFMTADRTKNLDASDANFVDVIHTDFFIFGNVQASGHVDFYPNFRFLHQPGCNPLQYMDKCDHFRAPIFYAESITTTVNFWSYACGTTLEFSLYNCYKYAHLPQILMGYFITKNASGSYFLTTNSVPPYARGPMKLSEELMPRRKMLKFKLLG